VIALAARNVPAHLRKRAILWGTFGAIAVRTAMTLVVVWLLKIPGLLAAGGLALVWIAFKLLKKEDGGGHEVSAADSFWGAMKTIVIADAVMGLDNVLAVAGAAHGSFLLVVLGLLISIPIVIWGSQIILKWVERFPSIVYIGSGVLAWTAAKMILSEPVVRGVVAANPWISWATYAIVIGGVIGGGWLWNHRKVAARVAEHLVDPAQMPAASTAGNVNHRGGQNMTKVLVPVDGSVNSLQAVRHVIAQVMGGQSLEVHLLHVRKPLSRHVARLVSGSDRRAYHRDEAAVALKGAREFLDRHSVPYACHVELGEKAPTINAVARRLRVGQIVMGTARKHSLTRLFEDSVTHRVLETADVPVQVIAGRSVSALERWGVPAGVGAAIALLAMIEE
jgi:YjbE family integral membrane protein